jgi:hypothetical protein
MYGGDPLYKISAKDKAPSIGVISYASPISIIVSYTSFLLFIYFCHIAPES